MFLQPGFRLWDQTFVPTIVAAAYASGDVIGTAVNVVPQMSAQDFDPNFIVKVLVADKSHQNAAIDLYFFNAPLSTVPTDNAAWNIPVADVVITRGLPKYLGKIAIAAGDATASASVQEKEPNPAFPFKTYKNRTLYVVVVSRGTPTYASASDLAITLEVAQPIA